MNALTRPWTFDDIFADEGPAYDPRAIVRRQMAAQAHAMKATRDIPADPQFAPARPARIAQPGVTVDPRGVNTREAVIEALEWPMTGPALAKRMGRKVPALLRLLSNMQRAGLVEIVGHVEIRGRDVKIWAATGASMVPVVTVGRGAKHKEETTRRMLGALDSPKTIAEIAAQLVRSDNAVTKKLADMEADGLVRKVGIKSANGRPAALWGRA